jgi:hypothetical protein
MLNALLIRQPDEPMGIQRVRRPLHPVEVKMDAFFFTDSIDVGLKLVPCLYALRPAFRWKVRLRAKAILVWLAGGFLVVAPGLCAWAIWLVL